MRHPPEFAGHKILVIEVVVRQIETVRVGILRPRFFR